ncbi:MAG: hypothetical protein V4618_09985 [Pseudomonadota bacterium]
MRSSFGPVGIFGAAGALVVLSQPPAMAQPLMAHIAICGSAAMIDIPLRRAPGRSKDDEQPCSAGCHALSAPRKRALSQDDDAG